MIFLSSSGIVALKPIKILMSISFKLAELTVFANKSGHQSHSAQCLRISRDGWPLSFVLIPRLQAKNQRSRREIGAAFNASAGEPERNRVKLVQAQSDTIGEMGKAGHRSTGRKNVWRARFA
ncbi:uncharacterized protein LOC27207331 [Drosophila simulans]|uniref:uncharacterized protein LOC27207331 n=1 Tax=Drosophila simulans TaxID=7240 RepID=UPI00192D14D5|nr:uncharacterized protein LOC27207331 [Drosophila simulans]